MANDSPQSQPPPRPSSPAVSSSDLSAGKPPAPPSAASGDDGADAPAHSRTFPFSRASVSSGQGSSSHPASSPAQSPQAPSRPSFAGMSRPSYISLPPRHHLGERGFPSPDVTSPSGRHSVSSAESSGSRIAPDLGGSSARYFPMRSVVYPTPNATSPATSAGTAASARSYTGAKRMTGFQGPGAPPPGSAEAVLLEEGFPAPPEDDGGSQPGAPLNEGRLADAAEQLGLLERSSSRGSSGENGRPETLRRTSSRTEGAASSTESPGASDVKPPSLDPYLSAPTTHAKIGDPDSDEEDDGEDEVHNAETESNVQQRDFGDETNDGRGGRLQTSAPREEGGSSYTGGSDKPMLMTSRFEHQVTEDGQILVLTGREGQLERCEDEPIHAPGAVQAFGVLIAFDLEEDERMKVQQVSENSGFVIGLPPRVLFRSKCLSELLDEDEADALRDAIDALDERDLDESNEEVGPYTFTLAGEGIPGSGDRDAQSRERFEWVCHAAIHRPNRTLQPKRIILELELVEDQVNPLSTVSSEPFTPDERGGMGKPEEYGENGINPTEADLIESTVSIAKPLRILARHRSTRMRRRKRSRQGLEGMDVVGLLSQINDQLGKADGLETFLKVTVGVFKELTEFDRVMIYQFDEMWNGRVVAEQVDWSRTRDLFRGLNFPASDIPAQARELYRINKVRVLYDRDQPTARLCCRSMEEVALPLDMTHCHLRAMSPIHIKYLGNMGVRSSMSISVTAFGDLWGLIALHTYGRYGHRVSFPVRQLCKLLGQSISRNIERISYASRLQARKLINTAASDQNPSGYIVAKAEDLLDLFHADFGVLSIGDEAKILGPVSNSQELLALLEYLRVKRFETLKTSQDIVADFPDIDYPNGFKLIAGLLLVPLSAGGNDFIVFCRKGQLQEIHWAGNPYANKKVSEDGEQYQALEPRKSFKIWSETVVGKSRAWTDEEKETASVLCLVYGKFIAVWREKESALAASQLTNLLLQNASHEVRTPLNAIINYLELALDGPIPGEVRENLVRSHAASKSLIHVINDLLDLTRTEKGNELYLTDPFNLAETLEESVAIHRDEAARRGLSLEIVETPTGTPSTLLGDRAKIRQIVTNVVGNALKHTKEGGILVEWGEVLTVEDASQPKQDAIKIGISVTDTGVGISEQKLENIFRQFENVATIGDKERDEMANTEQAVGLGLAVVARIVRNLDGQLQVESKVGKGSKFTFIFPFRLPPQDAATAHAIAQSIQQSLQRDAKPEAHRDPLVRRNSNGSAESRASRTSSGRSEIDSLINAMSQSHMDTNQPRSAGTRSTQSIRSNPSFRSARSTMRQEAPPSETSSRGSVGISGGAIPLRAARVGPSRGGGEPTTSPLSSPTLAKTQNPLNAIFNSPASPGKSPLSLGSAPPVESPPAERARRQSILSVTSEATANSTAADDTPRAKSPEPDAKAGTVSPTHVSEYRKSSAAPPVDTIEPMRVLVVEDEMVNRMIISQRLKKDGHEVIVAEHGGAAVRKFEEDRNFDIVLMDLQMPIMNGVDASKNIRRIERESPLAEDQRRLSTRLNDGIPILAVSASLPERERPTIVDAELNGWLLKPIDFKRLRTLMRGAIDNDARHPEIYRPGQWERGGWLTEMPQPDLATKA
ncbi:hypothetical protein JCM10296v2_006192 [Rhodotorula toruloides]